jgi:hypothetical protein
MTTLSQVPRVGVVFRPELPPERLRDFAAATTAAALDGIWLWEDCFLQGGADLSQGTSVRRIYQQRPACLRPPGTSRDVRNGSRPNMGGDR